MATFVSGYLDPGTYVQQIFSTNAVVTPGSFIPCVIGYSSKTTTGTITETVTRASSGSADVIASGRTGVTILSVRQASTGLAFKSGTDYTFSSVTNTITWAAAGAGIYRPAASSQYQVQYTSNKIAADYVARRFSSMNDVKDWYGDYSQSATAVINGSYIQNNITMTTEIIRAGWGSDGYVYCIELNPNDSTGTPRNLTTESDLYDAVVEALAKAEMINVWAIVPAFPMTTTPSAGATYVAVNATILTAISTHVTNMRAVSEQKWRTMLVGAPAGYDIGTSAEQVQIDAAVALGSNAKCFMSASSSNYGGLTCDGSAVAAAAASIATNPAYDAGEPILGKTFTGVTVPVVFNNTQRAAMGRVGTFMVDSFTGATKVTFDLTTDQSSDVRSQLKYTRAADYVSIVLQLTLNAYIGTRNTGAPTRAEIASSIKLIGNQLIQNRIINNISEPLITTNSQDRRQLDVVVSVQLTPDVVWIYIPLTLSLGA